MTLKFFYLHMILKIEQLGTSTDSKELSFSSLQTSAIGFFNAPINCWSMDLVISPCQSNLWKQ